ncbi:MAG: methyltransferase domain-containing protein [Gammaproteobacteria bacterium]|uniref:methyltransferase domain-containing protein n=1 Tax=Azohydromonas sp. TaxID=1872666 RepID=UPI002C583FA9|nr:methyltransferase domain-containing protein [Azohydromonas sp.]HMM85408.1 methyltransferase domain-containing protein [Azohydromonas sp.]
MSKVLASNVSRRDIDEVALARTLARMATAPPPWLHGEVARRMAERLPVILRSPASVLLWWGHLGASDEVLAHAYPQARRVAVEPAAAPSPPSRRGGPWWSPRRWRVGAPAPIAEADVPPGGAQLLWSNMMLHGVADPPALFARWRRALADDGFLMFSTLGPGTLAELRALYREAGWPVPAAELVDMHDLGDMLVEAGFADPVMDQERLQLTWPDADAALAELRTLGANVDRGRAAGLRTPRWRHRLRDALHARRDEQGRVVLGFEVVYGHAFNAPPRAKVTARTALPLDDFRAMTRRRPASPGRV